MKSYLLLSVALLAAAGCVNASDQSDPVNSEVAATDANTSSVNGGIRVAAGQKSGDVGTVNGNIRIESDASVTDAHTVNGDIHVGAHASAGSLNTVNGAIALDPGAHVNAAVTSVNGSLTMQEEAQIGGAVTNVNGDIVLTSAHIAGGISTVNGDINLKKNSRVEGGILVRRKNSGWFNIDTNPPRIVIGPGVTVQGDLRFEHKVRLYVSDQAKIGPVTGATPISFSGDNPPI